MVENALFANTNNLFANKYKQVVGGDHNYIKKIRKKMSNRYYLHLKFY